MQVQMNELTWNTDITLDGSNFDLSKFLISRSEIPVPIFSSIRLSKFTLNLLNVRSLEVLDLL
jgi:hypothetical protein